MLTNCFENTFSRCLKKTSFKKARHVNSTGFAGKLSRYSPSSTVLGVALDRDRALPPENLPAGSGCLTSFSEYKERATMSSSFFVSA